MGLISDGGEHTLLADSGGFWMDWHMVPPRPELRKLLGVEVPLNWTEGKGESTTESLAQVQFIIVSVQVQIQSEEIHLTFLTFPGVGVPAIRLLDGVLTAVPYSISSCVCLVFFICYLQTKIIYVDNTFVNGKTKNNV